MSVDALRDTVDRAVGVRTTAAVAVGGGDVARAGRFVLADGRSVFAKSVPGPRGMLAAEAAGLAWLRDGLATALGTTCDEFQGFLAARPMPYESVHPEQSARLASSGAT